MAVQSKNDLPRIGAQIEREISKAIRETAFEIWAEWKADVRVDTGFYRNSIVVEIVNALKAVIGTNCDYAAFNEFGTRFMKGRPSATEAFERGMKRLEARLSNIERSLR